MTLETLGLEGQDLEQIANLTTLQESVLNKFIKRTVSIAPAKDHKAFLAEIEGWIKEMAAPALFQFTMEYSRCGQKKELDMARAVYKNFKAKRSLENTKAEVAIG